MNKPIQIFKPGKHVAMNGAELSFSEADLAATAAAYDPAKHEAPLVVGHPKHDAPAYGWVKSLAFADPSTGSGRTDGALEAEPQQVDAAFAEMVTKGSFKKISASFYTPDSPQNPVPGVYYLRHVGFLGAQPPAVKGLRSPEFADAEEGVVEFGDWDDRTNARLLRSLRDWLIGKFGIDDADKALPNWDVQSLADSAAQPEPVESVGSPGFHEVSNQPQGDKMSAEEKARLAALELENAKMKQDAANFAEAEKKRVATQRHAEHVAFAEGLAKEGKLLPAQKDVAVATLDFIAGEDEEISFGEGDAKKPLADAFRGLLSAMPRQVEFAEVGKGDAPGAGSVEFAAAPGYIVDADKMAMHMKALNYAEQHKCDYVTAVRAVEKA